MNSSPVDPELSALQSKEGFSATGADHPSAFGCLKQWKPVPGFLEYEVSEHGDVRRGSKQLKPERTQGNDRKRFRLSVGGRLYTFKAAQLVALAFIGPKPFEGAEVCHNDGFKHNNHWTNLRWDTHAGNSADDLGHKLRRKSFVTESQRLLAEANELLR